MPVLDRVVVDPTFATRDLVRGLHRTPRHVVLVITHREARLFDGVGTSLVPAIGGAFPLEREITRAARDAERDAFLRIVDRALGTYLRLHPAPLVLVGAQRTPSRFTHLSRNIDRLAGTLQGSYVRMPLTNLAGLIRPVLERYLRSRQDEALAQLDQRSGANRVASGMQSVWLAARTEAPRSSTTRSTRSSRGSCSAEVGWLWPMMACSPPMTGSP